jgi:hypothetical protein
MQKVANRGWPAGLNDSLRRFDEADKRSLNDRFFRITHSIPNPSAESFLMISGVLISCLPMIRKLHSTNPCCAGSI